MRTYTDFLAAKAPRARMTGIEPSALPDYLFDFQKDVVSFGLRQGCWAAFLDTGLGKSRIQLEWSRQAADATNGSALILTPLAVAKQMEREAVALGYDARVIRHGDEARSGINICNYDRLDTLNPEAFGCVSLDESSILKSFGGVTMRALTSFMAGKRFRLAATATPAPNDHMELGQHAEALGIMPASEMLMRWFINDTSQASQVWRLKKHGVDAFWDWMASWSRCAGSPTDLGYDGSRYVLPELRVIRHRACGDVRSAPGSLFVGDLSATNMHLVKRQTAEARADLVRDLVLSEASEPWVIWCDTDYEADALATRLPDAIEVRGSHSADRKETSLDAFASGATRSIITKPSVAGQGMNWQHAARMAFVGRSFSYESWYQAVRRCWRFGQTRHVDAHLIVAEGEDQIGRVIDRKAADHSVMKSAMVAAMKRAAGLSAAKIAYDPQHNGALPSWLISAV